MSDDFVLLTLGYEDLFGGHSDTAGIIDRLRRSSLEGVVRTVGRISTTLYSGGGWDTAWRTQVTVCERLFGGQTRRVVGAVERARKDTPLDKVALFHERQLLNLLKLAFLVLPVGKTADVDLLTLGQALLMINDKLERGVGDDSNPDYVNRLEFYVFANTLFNQHPDAVHEVVRSYELYVAPRPELLQLPTAVDVPKMLEMATGHEPKSLWRILFLLFGYWFGLRHRDIDAGAHVRPTNWFASMSKVTPQESRRLFEAAGRSAEELKQAISKAYSIEEPLLFDVVEFSKSPLVFFDDRVMSTSVHLLRAAAGSNLQYRFLDDRFFSAKERQLFLDFRGVLYSDYVTRLLARVFADRLVPGTVLDDLLPNDSHCDGIIDYGDAALLIEIKAVLLPLAISAGKNLRAYADFMATAVPKAASQLASTVDLVESGALASLGLQPGRIRRYFPLLVTMHLPSNPITYEFRIDRGLTGHPITRDRRGTSMAPLQILDVHDIEAIENVTMRGLSLRDVLSDKVGNDATRRLAFINYLGTKGISLSAEHNPYLSARYNELTIDPCLSNATLVLYGACDPTAVPKSWKRAGAGR